MENYRENAIYVNNEVEKFFDDSSMVINESPKFVLITGIVGVGKTIIRRQQYQKGYVNIDAGDIFVNLSKGKWYKFPDAFIEPMEFIGGSIANKAIKEKRNIVMEIIGESLEDSRDIIDTMNSHGYKVKLIYVECNPVEAYKRHLNAAKNEVDYIPCAYAQNFHKKWLLDAAKEI